MDQVNRTISGSAGRMDYGYGNVGFDCSLYYLLPSVVAGACPCNTAGYAPLHWIGSCNVRPHR